jgi:DNA-binding NarL/FixJ family response regulator
VLVDDHAILRDGLRAILELEADFEVVGEAGTIKAGLEVIRRTGPDLIITDISMPGNTGPQVIVEMRMACPQARILVLTVHNTAEHIRAALAAGASGYVLKDASRAALINAARIVRDGQRHLCASSSSRMLETFVGAGAMQPRLPPEPSMVTGRERQIVAMIAGGSSTKNIANELHLSVKTVEKHRSNLMRKLGLHNVAAVTRFAIESGLVNPATTMTSGMAGLSA